MKNLGQAGSDKKQPKSDVSPAPASKAADPNAGEGPPVNQSNAENDFFNKHYNKELRVSKDEIPIVLAELNESAIAFIKKDQFERALNLLQKAYGIMDAIDFNQCRRDMYHLFVMFHNMALCYQKMQMLEECAQCIEHAFEHLPVSLINIEEKSISNRMRKVFIIGKLKLQYCAILSQIHRHKDALDQAREGVKVCHQMINDMHQLCQFYVQREKINNAYKEQDQQESQNISNQQLDEYSSRFENKRNYGSTSRNRSFSSFLSQQEAYSGFESISLQNVNQKSNAGGTNQKNNGRQQSLNIGQGSQNLGGIGNMTRGSHQSLHSLSSFCTVNELEKSISYVERTAKKLLPILTEVKKRMIPDKKRKKKTAFESGGITSGKKSQDEDSSDLEDEMIVDLTKVKNKGLGKKGQQFDMKNILGYLNQGENLQTLSIGNIMQLQAFKLKDLVEEGKNELELTRESFIMKLSHMAVAYFCYSTEIRFILQMKEDPAFETNDKQKESEFWHAKSLELACSFLPGECPLLNHINLSYQKHFAPVKTVIKEDEEEEDNLLVVKPLHGIENQKYHPIIKNMDDIEVSITPYAMTPLNAVTKPFINQLKSFNEYTENQKSQTNNGSFLNQNNSMNSRAGPNKGLGLNQQRSHNNNDRQNRGLDGHILEGISEDGPNETIGATSTSEIQNSQQRSQNQNEKDDDIKMLEKLFKKVQSTHNIDKVKLLKQLLDSNATGKQSKSNNKNILAGLVPKHTQNNKLDEVSQENFSRDVDFLMDENILTNDSREEDGEGRIVRTPNNNIKNQNVNSINQINSVVFNNQVGVKKAKNSKMVQSQKAGHHTSTLQNQSNSQILNAQQSQQNNLHQRPKTQINGQRNSSQREGKNGAGITSATNQSQHHLQSMDQVQQKQNSSMQANYQMSSKSGGTPSNVVKYGTGGQGGQNQKLSNPTIEQKSKRTSQRPFSGGIQKMIKSDNHKSRVQNFNQKNFSMYDQKNGNQTSVQNTSGLSQMNTHSGSTNPKSQGLSGGVGSHSTAQMATHSPNKFANSTHMRARNGEREGDQALYYNPQTSNSTQQLKGQNSVGSNQGTTQQQRDQHNQLALQKQIQQIQKQQQMAGGMSNVQMKNQLQGAANNIMGSHQPIPGIQQPENQQQYDDLKKRLLNEYKKMQKKGGERGANQQLLHPSQLQNMSADSQGQRPKAGPQSSQQQLQNFIYQKSQIEQSLQSSAKVMNGGQEAPSGKANANSGNEANASNQSNNLNNSTNSAHLNVYKPTFIINNSFQPGQSNSGATSGEAPPTHQETMPQNSRSSMKATQESVAQQINNTNNLAITSAGPHSSSGQRERSQTGANQQRGQNNGNSQQQAQVHAQMSKSSQNMMNSKKSSSQIRGSGNGTSAPSGNGHGSQKYLPKGTYSTQQQQLLLMNVLMSQGLDKAQAMAQVQAQMSQAHQAGSKTHKESRTGVSSSQLHANPNGPLMKKPLSSGNRHHGSNRGVTPTQESKSHVGLTGHHLNSQQQQIGGVSYLNQYQNQLNLSSSEGRGPMAQSKSTQQFQQHQQFNQNINQYQGGGQTLSAANLPQSSSVVTGGKMINSSSAARSGSQANQYQQHQAQPNYQQMHHSRKK